MVVGGWGRQLVNEVVLAVEDPPNNPREAEEGVLVSSSSAHGE